MSERPDPGDGLATYTHTLYGLFVDHAQLLSRALTKACHLHNHCETICKSVSSSGLSGSFLAHFAENSTVYTCC